MSGLCPIAPEDDIEALFEQHRRLSRWWAFLWGAYADQDEIATAEAATGSETPSELGSCLNLWINRVSLSLNPSLSNSRD